MPRPSDPIWSASICVDAGKYNAMKRAILAVLPKTSPGVTVAELKKRLLPFSPEDLFPGGAKAGWWLKGVQILNRRA